MDDPSHCCGRLVFCGGGGLIPVRLLALISVRRWMFLLLGDWSHPFRLTHRLSSSSLNEPSDTVDGCETRFSHHDMKPWFESYQWNHSRVS